MDPWLPEFWFNSSNLYNQFKTNNEENTNQYILNTA